LSRPQIDWQQNAKPPAGGHRRTSAVGRRLCGARGRFRRPRACVFNDNVLVGNTAAWIRGEPVSAAPFTDDERQLRDIAYAILMPPDERQTWERMLAEWHRTRLMPEHRTNPNPADYADLLLRTSYRSLTARHAKLIEDIRADSTRPAPFFTVAARVEEMDAVREKSIAQMWHVSPDEREHASIRIAENRMIVDWVQRRFMESLAGYQLPLDRLVVATPAPAAIEAERALAVLAQRINEYRGTQLVARKEKGGSNLPPFPLVFGSAYFAPRLRVHWACLPESVAVPSIVAPSTLPMKILRPAVKTMSLPITLPDTGAFDSPMRSEPESIWYFCSSFSSPIGVCQTPSTFAGTIQKCARHQFVQSPPAAMVWSGVQSPMSKVLETTRVPGFMSRIFGRSLRLSSAAGTS
jgi:hypothetical protein